jgi:hypothetical protein
MGEINEKQDKKRWWGVTVSQRRYRYHGLARLVKGIPAEIQTSWISKVGKGCPSGDTRINTAGKVEEYG